YDDDSCAFTLNGYPQDMSIAGSVNGAWGLLAVVADGIRAAKAVITKINQPADAADQLTSSSLKDPHAEGLNFAWPMFSHPKGKEFVDFDEDLQIADIVNATRDGYEHIQLVKRYSTCGMGPSQGRHSALAAARLVANATGLSVAQTGVTTARPPFAAEFLGLNAGRSFYPERRSNMHDRHLQAGAQMMQAGAWYRPAYYGEVKNRSACITQEVQNVRSNVGLVDVSTLGGIEVRGTNAAEFLNRFYTFTFSKQEVGKARYALLTNEAGVVIDDGVACRLHIDHYYVTATTGGVDRVFQSMLKWNAQWRLDVDIANATTAWCGVNLAGPKSRLVLQKLCDNIDLSNDSFPYMGVREGLVAGIPARVVRVGFVGELGYEIHVPQQYGEALWDALMRAGAASEIKPFGVEAQRILRLEKGHVIIGQDTDAMSNPMELQMNWAIARKKPFFVGSRTIAELQQREQQRVLVGFVIPSKLNALDYSIVQESHLIIHQGKMLGRVTSCSFSPTLNMPIGLAYLPLSLVEPGSAIQIKGAAGKFVNAEVSALPFFDPEGSRQDVSSDEQAVVADSVSNEITEQALRRNPLHRLHQSLGATFIMRSGAQTVRRYAKNKTSEIAQARNLAIADLTPLARIGFKGPETMDWLSERELSSPARSNQAIIANQDLTIARLSETEVLILDSLAKPSKVLKTLVADWSLDNKSRTYLLERADSHACFALLGDKVPEMLAKVCAVDMRLHKFAQLSIAQTSIAKINGILLRADQGQTPCFYLLADLSSAQYLWECLSDAMQEFNGKPIGLDALQTLPSQKNI
ncbi:MAG: glycine cleavage system aminomethyltransferase T, partial [Arenicella sp.]